VEQEEVTAAYPAAGFSVTFISGMPVVATPRFVDSSNADQLRTALLAAAGQGTAWSLLT
jgi:hypothetical protein